MNIHKYSYDYHKKEAQKNVNCFFSLTLLFLGSWEAIVFIEIEEQIAAQPWTATTRHHYCKKSHSVILKSSDLRAVLVDLSIKEPIHVLQAVTTAGSD